MKKLLLSLSALVFIVANLNAQDTKFGVKAGANFANLGGDAENTDIKVGLHVGGVVNFMFTERFALSPELLVSFQGTKEEDGGFTSKTNLTYINVPVLAKVFVTEGLNIHAGPYVGFLLAAKTKLEFEDEEEEVDIKEEMNGLDFGLAFGAGYELESGLNFGARYNLGLGNIVDTAEDEDFTVTNQVIQIYVGFNF